MTVELKRLNELAHRMMRTMADEYEMDSGDDTTYVPSAQERALLLDFAMGLLAEPEVLKVIAAWVNEAQAIVTATEEAKHGERETLRKAIMDEMKFLSRNHDRWSEWPGTWAFAEAALRAIGRAHNIHKKRPL